MRVQAKAEMQKSIRRAKDRMSNDYRKNLRGAEVWRVPMFTNRQAGLTMEAPKNRDGEQTYTITKQEEMVRQ